MSIVRRVYIFIVNRDGDEQIVTWPNKEGINVPLVYFDKKEIETDKMREAIQEVADGSKLYFELREYCIIDESTETFYPTKTKHDC